jgi:hypothetical protein
LKTPDEGPWTRLWLSNGSLPARSTAIPERPWPGRPPVACADPPRHPGTSRLRERAPSAPPSPHAETELDVLCSLTPDGSCKSTAPDSAIGAHGRSGSTSRSVISPTPGPRAPSRLICVAGHGTPATSKPRRRNIPGVPLEDRRQLAAEFGRRSGPLQAAVAERRGQYLRAGVAGLLWGEPADADRIAEARQRVAGEPFEPGGLVR